MKITSVNLLSLIPIGLVSILGIAGPAAANHYQSQTNKSYYAKQRLDNNDGCAHYQVSAYGGDGGIRFLHNIDGWKLVQGRGQHSKVCKSGYVTVELSKRHPATTVFLAMNGQTYLFESGEPAHKYINNWYRKYIDIPVPKARHGVHAENHSDGRAQYSNPYGYNHHSHQNVGINHFGYIDQRYGLRQHHRKYGYRYHNNHYRNRHQRHFQKPRYNQSFLH